MYLFLSCYRVSDLNMGRLVRGDLSKGFVPPSPALSWISWRTMVSFREWNSVSCAVVAYYSELYI